MAELGRRPDRPDASDDQPANQPGSGNPERTGPPQPGVDRSGTDRPQPGDRADQGRDRPRVPGYSRADAFRNPTINELFAATEDPAFAPPEERARLTQRDRRDQQSPPDTGSRTDTSRESASSELAGLRDRAATDRAELHNRQTDESANTGPGDGPERESNRDRTEQPAQPGDRPADDDANKPADPAKGGGRDGGDGPKNPPPDNPGPDEHDSPNELAAAKARIAELEKEVAAVKAENAEKDAAIDRLENTCNYLDNDRKAANARAGEQNAKIDALTDKVDQLGTMLGEALKQIESPDQANTDVPRNSGSDRADRRAIVSDDAREDEQTKQAWWSRLKPSDGTLSYAQTLAPGFLSELAIGMSAGHSAIANSVGFLANVGLGTVLWARGKLKEGK